MSEHLNAIHKQTYILHSFEVDQGGMARPDILLSFMLDTAWAHTKDTEFSYSELKDEGQLWVLSRFLAVFHDIPKWGDEIIVETWGKGVDRLFGIRDFVVHSRSGEKVISATSAWLIIDRKTSRVQRIDSLGKKFPLQLERNELDVKLAKIEGQPSEKTGFEYVVRYSDLDVNKHVSSSRYVQWLLDSFIADFREPRRVRSFEINYLAEARLGEKIFVASSRDGDHFYCEVRRDPDNTELCRALVTWSD